MLFMRSSIPGKVFAS